MPYLLDSNVFMQAKRLHYGFDFCPAFWDWLIESNTAAKVFSVEKVADEIDVGGDDLSDWASDRGPTFFLTPDAQVLPALQTVSKWVNGQGYGPSAVNGFLQVASTWSRMRSLRATRSSPTRSPAAARSRRCRSPTSASAWE